MNAFNILTGKQTYRKKPLGKSRRTWEDNLGMDLKEVNNTRNWVDSA